MQREIKFRILIRGKWEYFNWLYSEGFATHLECYGDENTIGQFTGLKDKNGKEIYEGDIVKIAGFLYTVIYHSLSAAFLFASKAIPSSQLHQNCEVLGNIYENKDLLN